MIEKSTSNNIKVLGVVMTAAIVALHCGPTSSPNLGAVDLWLNGHVTSFIKQLAVLAMSYFFTVSGFLLFSGLTFEKISLKIKKRVRTLLIPYLIWQMLSTVYLAAVGTPYSIERWIGTVFLFQSWPPNGALWYVYAIFLLACCSYLILPLLKNPKVGAIVVTICFFVCYKFYYSTNPAIQKISDYGFFGVTIYYLPAYILGAYAGLHSDNKHHTIALCMLILIAGFIFVSDNGESIAYITVKCIPTLMLLLLNLPVIGEGSTVYKTTFLVYALQHQPYLSWLGGIERSIAASLPSIALANISFRLVYCFSLFALAIALYHILMRINASFVLSLLTGGRAERSLKVTEK